MDFFIFCIQVSLYFLLLRNPFFRSKVGLLFEGIDLCFYRAIISCICIVDPLYLHCLSFVSALSILCICIVDPFVSAVSILLYLQCQSFESVSIVPPGWICRYKGSTNQIQRIDKSDTKDRQCRYKGSTMQIQKIDNADTKDRQCRYKTDSIFRNSWYYYLQSIQGIFSKIKSLILMI